VGRIFGQDVDVQSRAVIPAVLITVLAPVIVGAATRALMPSMADRIARPVQAAAGVLLVLAFVPVLISSFGDMLELIGDGTLLAISVYIAAGLVLGHLLGGPEQEDRTVLALSTISRHPAVAVGAGTAAAPREQLVVAAVLLYLVLSFVAARLYVRWSTRGRPQASDVGIATGPVPKHP
jgi:BASS family bile acid:Na+ symporter